MIGMLGPACYRTVRFSSDYAQPEISRVLDGLAMPPLPADANIAFDAAYITSTPGVRVGGDWFAASVRDDRTYAISIGDIEGSGVKAAAPMISIRAALMALEGICADPVRSLEYLETFIDCLHPSLFATAFLARYDPSNGSLCYANAGHPAPFVRRAGGAIERLAAVDVPLGAGFMGSRALYQEQLGIGDVLVAFTDGLTELTHDIEEGESRIIRALRSRAFAASARPAKWLRSELISKQPNDDVAILAMRVRR
jgi:serine phosphatase RsbU (regulator of sigma subunit)